MNEASAREEDLQFEGSTANPCSYRKGYYDCAMETTYGGCPYYANGKCGCVGGSNV